MKTALVATTIATCLFAGAVNAKPPPRPLYPEPVYAMPKPAVYVWACKLGYMPACRRVREP